MTITAVGFDLDETLAVPTRDRTAILADAVEAVDAPPLTRESYLRVHGRNLTTESRTPIFAELLADHDAETDPDTLARVYREKIADAITPLDGVEPFIDGLRERYRVGLLTNGPQTAQRDKIRALGWTDVFDASLVTGELDAGKPDPAAFAALLDALGSEPGETVYVGDDVDADIGGASDAGLLAVQVTYEGGPAPSPRADAHIPRERLIADLPALLESLS